MSCRTCQATDPTGRPTREAAESRARWGCDAPLARDKVTVWIDCQRCGGSGQEPDAVGPCARCWGDKRGMALRRCPNAAGELSATVGVLRMAACEARERRFPGPGHIMDQPIMLLALAGLFSACEDQAKKAKEEIEKRSKPAQQDIAAGLPPAIAHQYRRAKAQAAAAGKVTTNGT